MPHIVIVQSEHQAATLPDQLFPSLLGSSNDSVVSNSTSTILDYSKGQKIAAEVYINTRHIDNEEVALELSATNGHCEKVWVSDCEQVWIVCAQPANTLNNSSSSSENGVCQNEGKLLITYSKTNTLYCSHYLFNHHGHHEPTTTSAVSAGQLATPILICKKEPLSAEKWNKLLNKELKDQCAFVTNYFGMDQDVRLQERPCQLKLQKFASSNDLELLHRAIRCSEELHRRTMQTQREVFAGELRREKEMLESAMRTEREVLLRQIKSERLLLQSERDAMICATRAQATASREALYAEKTALQELLRAQTSFLSSKLQELDQKEVMVSLALKTNFSSPPSTPAPSSCSA